MEIYEIAYESMGTAWMIRISDAKNLDEGKKALIKGEIIELSATYDREYSRFRDDSFVINTLSRPGKYSLSPELKALFDYYKKFYDLSGGKFTPFIGQMLVDAGYDKDYSFAESELRAIPSWDDAIIISEDSIEIKRPVVVDIGAVGKGFFVDKIAELLSEHSITDFLVDGSGDIYTSSSMGEVTRAGLEHPLDEKKVIGVVNIANKALCGSSGNRRAWGSYHHIMDPDTRKSPENILATWVVADKAALADGAATCLFFVPPEKLSGLNISYIILHSDLHVTFSQDLDLELF